MGSITGANAIFTLGIPGVFSTPQPLQGYAPDEAFLTQAIKRAEVAMGVDGLLSGGFVNVAIPQSITLQADSPSNDIFDQWDGAQQSDGETITAIGIIILPSISRKWSLSKGFLTTFSPMPAVKKLLQPRTYEITWEALSIAPL